MDNLTRSFLECLSGRFILLFLKKIKEDMMLNLKQIYLIPTVTNNMIKYSHRYKHTHSTASAHTNTATDNTMITTHGVRGHASSTGTEQTLSNTITIPPSTFRHHRLTNQLWTCSRALFTSSTFMARLCILNIKELSSANNTIRGWFLNR